MENTVPRQMDWGRHAVWVVTLLLYGVALCLPALVFDHSGQTAPDVMFGFEVALLGWLGVFIGQFGWMANFSWFISLFGIMFRVPLLALIPSGIALLISLQTFMLFVMEVPADEGGVNHLNLQYLGPGAWLWWLALLIPFVWGIVALISRLASS